MQVARNAAIHLNKFVLRMTTALASGLTLSVEHFNGFRVLENPQFKGVAPLVFLPRMEPRSAIAHESAVVLDNLRYVDFLSIGQLDQGGTWQLRRV